MTQPAQPELPFDLPVRDRQKERAGVYYYTFTSETGKAVLEDLRKAFGDRPSYIPGADPQLTAFREGQRDVYLRIVHLINLVADPKSPLNQPEEESEE